VCSEFLVACPELFLEWLERSKYSLLQCGAAALGVPARAHAHFERSAVGALGVHVVFGALGVWLERSPEYSELAVAVRELSFGALGTLGIISEVFVGAHGMKKHLSAENNWVHRVRSSVYLEWLRRSSWCGLSARSTPCCSAEQQHSSVFLL
jgi:hypothetical protein